MWMLEGNDDDSEKEEQMGVRKMNRRKEEEEGKHMKDSFVPYVNKGKSIYSFFSFMFV